MNAGTVILLVVVFVTVVVPFIEACNVLYRLCIKGEESVPGDLSRDERQRKLDEETRWINTHLH